MALFAHSLHLLPKALAECVEPPSIHGVQLSVELVKHGVQTHLEGGGEGGGGGDRRREGGRGGACREVVRVRRNGEREGGRKGGRGEDK